MLHLTSISMPSVSLKLKIQPNFIVNLYRNFYISSNFQNLY